MAAKASLRCFLGIVFSRHLYIEERSTFNSLFNLNIRVAEDHFRKLSKRFQFPALDIGCIFLFEPVDVHSTIVLLEEDDRSQAPGLSFPCPSDTLFDYPSI
jgi:hypothetical protein